jgi:hypothetical protein
VRSELQAGSLHRGASGGAWRRIARVAVVATLGITLLATPTVASAHGWAPSNYLTFVEQVASRGTITALVDNEISSLRLGRCRRSRGTATVPVTAYFRDGRVLSGTLVLKQWNWHWYFYSIGVGKAGGISNVVLPPDISSSVMNSAWSRQHKYQTVVANIIYNRYSTVTVGSIARNWGTATVKVRLSAPRRRARNAQIVCTRRDSSNGKTYWFITLIR